MTTPGEATKLRDDDPFETGLYDADPNCIHDELSQPGGGVKCRHCGGWFCF